MRNAATDAGVRVRGEARTCRFLALAIGIVALLALAACRREPDRHRETLRVFGGEATIEIAGSTPQQARPALDALAERYNAMHRDWHAWEPGALTALNAAIARGDTSFPPASIRALILRSQPLSIRSDGVFDPAIGGLMQLWGFHTREFPVTTPMPTREQIDAWRVQRPSVADVVVDGATVFSHNRAVQLDFGGIAEGVAAEEATRLLGEHGIGNALLSLGTDYYALGDLGGKPWIVGIRDPYGGVLAEVALGDGEALFTAGNYDKFREAPSGARWSQILDPRSGQPVQGTAAVAVLHSDAVLADIAATTLMVGGPARFADLLRRLGVRCALLLTEENEMQITAAMAARVTLHREPVRLGPALGVVEPCTPDAAAR